MKSDFSTLLSAHIGGGNTLSCISREITTLLKGQDKLSFLLYIQVFSVVFL